ncbi:hypothetical protein [Listeria ilorinensis]|uniref:hypothetical protein n=1 Tax=Listeria ilorinensis TaxID=2867439 RepID=UPI001EF506D0|nr:hypothetical protein [Listeria ilorinensis]
MMTRTVECYVITHDQRKCCSIEDNSPIEIGYRDSDILAQMGYKFLWKKVLVSSAFDDGNYVYEPVKNFIIDAEREEKLLEDGYYGKDVILE